MSLGINPNATYGIAATGGTIFGDDNWLSVTAVTAEQIRRARLRVAENARSSRECRSLLDMLGIGAK